MVATKAAFITARLWLIELLVINGEFVVACALSNGNNNFRLSPVPVRCDKMTWAESRQITEIIDRPMKCRLYKILCCVIS